MTQPVPAAVAVTEHPRLNDADRDPAWRVYWSAFETTRTQAVQRHLLRRAEFDAIAADPRITKWAARDRDGQIVGVSVSTADLNAWELIEPAYFAARWPQEYARRAVWYIGFVAAVPGAPVTVFPRLIAAMLEPIRVSRGIGVLDYSTARIDRGLADASQRWIARFGPLRRAHQADAQHYWVYEFNWDRT